MIGGEVRGSKWRGVWLMPAGLAGSQWGHLLAYQLRFGTRAAEIEGSGGHAYFPTFVTGALSILSLVTIASLGILGAARVAGGRRQGRPIAQPSVINLLAVLFTLQITVFGIQEGVESAASGTLLEPVVLLYGIACQLPVALVGAIALSLFLARLEEAVERLRERASSPWPGPEPIVRLSWPVVEAPRPMPLHLRTGWGSRGPPLTSR
jgi:hypothetical protein